MTKNGDHRPQTMLCTVSRDNNIGGVAIADDQGKLFINRTMTYETTLASDQRGTGVSISRAFLSWLRRRSFRKNRNDDAPFPPAVPVYRFTYEYNEIIINATTAAIVEDTNEEEKNTGLMLIHPIGVGIGKWYYDRLFSSFADHYSSYDVLEEHRRRFVILAPDLLGSATACCPMDIASGTQTLTTTKSKKLPLLNITDWSGQILHLMAEYESKYVKMGHSINNWCIIANGGCSPIALHVAASNRTLPSPQGRAPAPVTNVILSSPPRLQFFLPDTNYTTADPSKKVRKSYRILSGILGKIFWWYALRNNGSFIQKFSERNLVGDATNLGEVWTPNCLQTAKLHNGQSRFSTFAFLAGALQDGCLRSLSELKDSNITTIDFICGTDSRRNPAKSWFWARRRMKRKRKDTEKPKSGSDASDGIEEMTIQQYVLNNGMGGKELFVDGARISLAWENSDEYRKKVLELCK